MTSISFASGVSPQAVTDQAPASSAAPERRPVASSTAVPGRSRSQAQVSSVVQPNAHQPSTEELKRMSAALQDRVSRAAPELSFSVDQSSGRSIIKITDPVTNEVIREIPSEEAQRIDKALDQFQRGLLINNKV
jgi:flagellar protein FlaG